MTVLAGAKRRLAQLTAVGILGVAALGVGVGSATAAYTGAPTNGCYGIWWNTAWAQECGTRGAAASGYFKSEANCTAPQIPNNKFETWRQKGSKDRQYGKDCMYGIHGVTTWHRGG